MTKRILAPSILVVALVLSACQWSGGDGSEKKEETPSSEREATPEEKEQPKEESSKENDTNSNDSEEDSEKQGNDSIEQDDQSSMEDSAAQPSATNENGVLQEHKSVTAVINKQRQLPKDYVPSDLVVPDVPFYFEEFHPKKQMRKEAARHLETLFSDAEQAGIELVAASGYRSFDRQQTIYKGNVENMGEEEANQVSAQPGHSEHQSGLAMDVTNGEVSFQLIQEFGKTEAGMWLVNHAHEHGFIIRYPKGKESITGYSYEPWHLRFVGEELATEIHNSTSTLEEYFGIVPE